MTGFGQTKTLQSLHHYCRVGLLVNLAPRSVFVVRTGGVGIAFISLSLSPAAVYCDGSVAAAELNRHLRPVVE
jgi:hypothetical protein